MSPSRLSSQRSSAKAGAVGVGVGGGRRHVGGGGSGRRVTWLIEHSKWTRQQDVRWDDTRRRLHGEFAGAVQGWAIHAALLTDALGSWERTIRSQRACAGSWTWSLAHRDRPKEPRRDRDRRRPGRGRKLLLGCKPRVANGALARNTGRRMQHQSPWRRGRRGHDENRSEERC